MATRTTRTTRAACPRCCAGGPCSAAERNLRAMLQTLLGSLGFTEVEVTFD
jgi:hypothetical protein